MKKYKCERCNKMFETNILVPSTYLNLTEDKYNGLCCLPCAKIIELEENENNI